MVARSGRRRRTQRAVTRRRIRILVVMVVVAMLGVSAVNERPAVAQLDVDELAQTEAEILARQAELDAEIAVARQGVAEAESALVRAQADRILLRRDLADAHHRDDRAAAALRSLAVQRYVLGDPRIDDFVNEILQERATVEPAIERALYAQVLEEAIDSADGTDAVLDDLRDRLDARLTEIDERTAELPVLRGAVTVLEAAKSATDVELTAIRDELDWERSLLRRARLTGRDDGTDNSRPVLAVKIDNVTQARPQTGINQADVVFEELVEGDLTRLVGLFHSTGSDPVGPIRSVRTSDVHILANLNRPLLGNSGGNPGVMEALRASPVIDVGALSPIAARYFRSPDKPAPNNLFSTTTDLWAAGQGSEAGAAPPLFSFRRPDRPWGGDAQPTSGVDIDYGANFVSYRWDATSQQFLRSQGGSPHVDSAGAQVAPTNVIVQVTGYRPTVFAQFSPEAQVEGEGEVFVFAGGEVRTGTWRRNGPEAPTRYLDTAGNEIELLPGSTWIALAPPGSVTVR